MFINVYELNCQSGFKNDKYVVHAYNYGFKDGLTFGAKDMVIDDIGHLWMQEYDNLAQYNGFQFTYYHPDDSNIFARPRRMTDIISDRNRKIWIAAETSIYTYSKSKGFIQNLLLFDSKPFDNITTLYANKENKIWCGNNKGKLILYDPVKKNNLKEYTMPLASEISCIYEDIFQQIWVSCDLGLYVFTIDGKLKDVYSYKNISTKIDTKCIKIAENMGNHISINLKNKMLFFNAKKHTLIESFTIDTPDELLYIKDYLEIKQNLFIITTTKGIIFYNSFDKIPYHGSFASHNDFNFAENVVNRVILTDNGVLLFGTNSGLTKLQYVNEPFKSIIMEEDATPMLEYAKEIDAWQKEWLLVTNLGSMYRFKINGRILTKIVSGRKNKIQGAALSYDGDKLYTISDGILLQYNIDTLKSLNNVFVLCNTQLKKVKKIRTDSVNNIWILDQSGLYVYNIYQKILSKIKIDSEEFSDIEILKNGQICICGKKLYCKQSIDDFKVIPVGVIQNIHDLEDGNNNDIFLSAFSGLYHYNFTSQKTIRYTMKEGMSSDNAGNLKMVDTYLWITYSSGLQRFNPINKIFQAYNFEFGLNQNNCYDQKLFAVNRENLVLGGNNYFSYYQDNSNSPLELIDFSLESVYFDGKLITEDSYSNQTIEVPPTVKLVDLRFNFPLFLEPSYFYIEYRLSSGRDTTWQVMAKGMSLSFYELKPDRYRLELRATDVNMPEFKKYYSLSLVIIAPFYQKTGFQVILFLMFSSLISLIFYFLYRYRLSQIRKLENLRLGISRDLHDEMGSELSTIKMLSERELLKSPSNENSSFRKIAETSSTVMENMSDIVWSINPANDEMDKIIEKIQNYAYEILESKGINVLMEIDDDVKKYSINVEKRRHFYLIFKESINNIAKYAQATEVKIYILLKGNVVDSTIYDNGVGFYTLGKTQGNGLRNMKERAELIGGNIEIASNSQNGTTVHFTFKV